MVTSSHALATSRHDSYRDLTSPWNRAVEIDGILRSITSYRRSTSASGQIATTSSQQQHKRRLFTAAFWRQCCQV